MPTDKDIQIDAARRKLEDAIDEYARLTWEPEDGEFLTNWSVVTSWMNNGAEASRVQLCYDGSTPVWGVIGLLHAGIAFENQRMTMAEDDNASD